MSFDVEKFKQHISDSFKEVAIWAASEIESAYEDAVTAFYDDYDPHWYHRTESTYKGSSGYHKNPASLVQPYGEFGFESGIEVDSTYIPGSPYREHTTGGGTEITKEFIFNNTFLYGLHGYNDRSIKSLYNSIYRDKKPWKHRMTRQQVSKDGSRTRKRADSPSQRTEREHKKIAKQIELKMNNALRGIDLY